MDTENLPTNPNTQVQNQNATQSQASPQSYPQPPSFSMTNSSHKKSGLPVFLSVLIAAVVAGASGYVLGTIRNKASVTSDVSPSPTIAVEKKAYTRIVGNVKTDSYEFDYMLVDVSEYTSQKATKHDIRIIQKPQANIEYPYIYDQLKTDVTYSIIVKGCKDKGTASSCVASESVLACSGRIPVEASPKQCLVRGDGNADFFLDKNLLEEIVVRSKETDPIPFSAPSPTPAP